MAEAEQASMENRGTIASLSGIPRFHTFRMRGGVQGHRVTVLVDGGASHNFMLSTRLHKLDFLKSRRRMSKQCSYTQNSVIQQALKRPIFPYFHCCNKCFKHERM
jgi:hypothetical protein